MNQTFAKRDDAVLIALFYCEDLIDSIFDAYLTPLATQCDLIVTVTNDVSNHGLKKIKTKFENCFIVQTPNWGQDIRPFIIAYRMAHELGYSYACKIHTKKSLQRLDGEQWRTHMLDSLLRSSDNVANILTQFQGRPSLGIVAPHCALIDLSLRHMHSGNTQWLDRLLTRLHEEKMIGKYEIHFPAGSMYWFRMAALSQLLDDDFVSIAEFELGAGQVDGTLAHALERMIRLLPICNNYEIKALDD